MVIRAKKTKRKTAAKKAVSKKRKAAKDVPSDSLHWDAVKNLQKQINETWKDLTSHIKRNDTRAWMQDSNRLMLLLGECRYMQNEYDSMLQNAKRKRKR